MGAKEVAEVRPEMSGQGFLGFLALFYKVQ